MPSLSDMLDVVYCRACGNEMVPRGCQQTVDRPHQRCKLGRPTPADQRHSGQSQAW